MKDALASLSLLHGGDGVSERRAPLRAERHVGHHEGGRGPAGGEHGTAQLGRGLRRPLPHSAQRLYRFAFPKAVSRYVSKLPDSDFGQFQRLEHVSVSV